MEVRKKLSDMLPNQSVSAMFSGTNGLSSSMTSLSSSHNATTSYSSASSSLVQYIDSVISLASIPSDGEIREPEHQYLQEDHTIFKAQHDRQLLQWLNRRPEGKFINFPSFELLEIIIFQTGNCLAMELAPYTVGVTIIAVN